MTVVLAKSGPVAVKSWPLARAEGRSSSVDSVLTQSSLGLEMIGGRWRSYEQMYREQPWVAIAVNKLSRAIGGLPDKVFELDEATGDRKRVRDHPLSQLLRRPYPGGSPFRRKEAIVGSLALHGNALEVKWRPRAGQPPFELWPVPWRNVRVVSGSKRAIEAYEYQGPLGRVIFQPEDVIHYCWWSPDGHVGVSPLEPLRRTLQMEDAAQRYAVASFRNAARPGGAIVGQFNAEQREAMAAQVRAMYEGPDNALRVAILSNADWKPFSHTAQESEVIAHRKLNREEVSAAYDIPPPMIGQLDRATFSNITEQSRMFYMDTLRPWLTMMEETMTAQLVDLEAIFSDVFIEFDLSERLKGNVKERADAYQQFLQSGVMTPNELRRLENLPAIDDRGADSVYVPLNMQALDGRIPSNDSTPVGTPTLARNGDSE